MEDSFDEDAYYERLGTRPPLDVDALGSSYRRMVELFYLCTEEDAKKRPSASQIVQALESNSLLDKTPSEVIVIDWFLCSVKWTRQKVSVESNLYLPRLKSACV